LLHECRAALCNLLDVGFRARRRARILPKVRLLSPHLSEVEALRAAARMAEYRLNDEDTIVWGWR